MTQPWMASLEAARKALRLSRETLAARSGVSAETIKAYERGTRNPSRATLVALLDEMQVDRIARNRILESAGFAPDGGELAPGNVPGYWYSLQEAIEAVEARRWPAHLNSEMVEVLAANSLMQRVWGVDFASEFTGPLERNMLTVASLPRFADRILNWEEMVSRGIAIVKGHHRGGESTPEASSTYFAAVLQRLFQGDPRYVTRFLDLWGRVEPQYPKVQWSYPVVWDHPTAGILRFEVEITTANDVDGFTFCDWIPLDAGTWEGLSRLGDEG